MASDVTERPTGQSQSNDAVDTVGRLLMAGVATVISAAATFGAVTGNIAFLLRNRGLSMGIALCLAGLAATIAAAVVMWPKRLDRPWLIRAAAFGISGVFLAAALGLVFSTQANLASAGSRPVIKVGWDTGIRVPILTLDAEADGLTIDDRLFANVLAYPGDKLSVKHHAFVSYYAGFTGPDVNGHAEQRVSVPVPLWSTQEVNGERRKVPIKSVMVAVIVDKQQEEHKRLITPERSFGVTCEGEVYASKKGLEVREDHHVALTPTPPACVFMRAVTSGMAAPVSATAATARPTATPTYGVTLTPTP